MSNNFPWHCPFCQHKTTVNSDRYSISEHNFVMGNKHGPRVIRSTVISCPNPECREFTITVSLHPRVGGGMPGAGVTTGKAERIWNLVPQANIKIFPDYVPAPILADYQEACLIKGLSPKASATLARRALQGMIRDFWGITKSRLIDEIEALKDKVDPVSWEAIDSVRRIGNIGAHMEKDINLVVEVDAEEAGLLISLIETLIQEWYVAREERSKRMAAVIAAAQGKANPSPQTP